MHGCGRCLRGGNRLDLQRLGHAWHGERLQIAWQVAVEGAIEGVKRGRLIVRVLDDVGLAERAVCDPCGATVATINRRLEAGESHVGRLL